MSEPKDYKIESAGGLQLNVRKFPAEGEEKARIVYVHGFSEHVGVYDDIFPAVAKAGYSICVFDQRGHGNTAKYPSEFGNGCDALSFLDIDAILESELKDYDGKIFLWGHSMGGGLTLTYMVRGSKRERISGYVALSPYVLGHPDRTRSLLYYAGQVLAHVMPRWKQKLDLGPEWCTNDESKYEAYLSDPLRHNTGSLALLNDMIQRGKQLLNPAKTAGIIDKPLLLCHGTKDPICWFEGSKQFIDQVQLSDKKFNPYDGLPHELLQCLPADSDKVLKDILEWTDAHL